MNDMTGHVKTEICRKMMRAMVVILSLWLSVLPSFVLIQAEDKGEVAENRQNEGVGNYPGNLAEDLGNNIVRVTNSLMHEERVLEEKTGTGFLISTSMQDALIVTTCDVLFSGEESDVYKEQIAKESGDNNTRINIEECFSVSFGGDIQSSAERIGNISEKRNILVLKANNLVSSEEALKITPDAEILENVLLAGYAEESNKSQKYDVDNLTVYPGTIMEGNEQGEEDCIRLKIDGENLDDTNLLGSPIVNEKGCVTGIFSGTDSGHYALAIPAHYLKELLDYQGIAVSESVTVTGKKRPVYIYVLVIAAAILAVFTLSRLLLDAKNRLLIAVRGGFARRGKERHVPKLSRIRTNEMIAVDKDTFYVGTDQKQCDFIIENNRTVEPVQFCILHEKKNYYMVNLGRYTDTLLNDKETVQKRKIRIKNRMSIQAGNERFIFLMD